MPARMTHGDARSDLSAARRRCRTCSRRTAAEACSSPRRRAGLVGASDPVSRLRDGRGRDRGRRRRPLRAEENQPLLLTISRCNREIGVSPVTTRTARRFRDLEVTDAVASVRLDLIDAPRRCPVLCRPPTVRRVLVLRRTISSDLQLSRASGWRSEPDAVEHPPTQTSGLTHAPTHADRDFFRWKRQRHPAAGRAWPLRRSGIPPCAPFWAVAVFALAVPGQCCGALGLLRSAA